MYCDVIIAILHTLGFQGQQPVPEGLRFVPREVREELYVLIGPEQLICKQLNVLLELLYLFGLGVIIPDRRVRDLGGLARVGKGADVLFEVLI